MKKLLLLLSVLLIGQFTFAQDMKVKWEDNDGREFSIRVLSGRFEYGMIPGDDISYDYLGDNVNKVGTTRKCTPSCPKTHTQNNIFSCRETPVSNAHGGGLGGGKPPLFEE